MLPSPNSFLGSGRRGNLTESTATVGVALGLSVPVFVGVIYFMVFQTYVLRLELILFAGELILLLLQTVTAIFSIAAFSR